MSQMIEKSVFEEFKSGNRQAFHILFQKYYQPLFLFARKFVDVEIAEDLVQDCFYDLWANRKKIEIKTSLSAYLFTIIKNRCYKFLKAEQQKEGLKNKIGLLLKQEELRFYINSEQSILEFDVKDRIKKVVDEMPEKCCEIFKESRYKGISNKEIAAKFGISVKAVEKQITKALKLFREEFKDILIFLIIFLIFKK